MNPPVGPIPLDAQLCFALYSASIAVNRLYKPLLDQLGITYPQYLVLSVLWEGDARTVGALAERLALESSTLTPLLKRLEAAGFAKRERNPEDERQVVVTLTSKGRALQHDSRCLGQTLFQHAGLAPSEMMRLNRELTTLRDSLVRGAAVPAPRAVASRARRSGPRRRAAR